MKMLDALRRLRAAEMDLFSTGDAAAMLGIPAAHASKIAARLAEAEQVIRLKRGVWAFPDRLDPLQIPPALTAPVPCCISLQSALFYHGLISQIPSVIYAVSPSRTRRWDTPAGTVSIHQLTPSFFFDFELVGKKGIPMASPEKALLDTLYLSPGKTRLFRYLPELDLPETFNVAKTFEMAARIPSVRRRTWVLQRLDELLLNAG
jgi:predicted transcriptional regulator of viral defense system